MTEEGKALHAMIITLKKILHSNRFRIGIFFEAAALENAAANRIGAVYSKTWHCWHLPYAPESLAEIRSAFSTHEIIIENPEPGIISLINFGQRPTFPQVALQFK